MGKNYESYRSLRYSLPKKSLAWNLYGAGMENMGHGGAPEPVAISDPDEDQLLVRIDSVSICFSDVKILKQGGNHPKLYHRDLANNPTRLGHEVALTIVKVGKNLQSAYRRGQRLAVQPDIYQNGRSTAYGYTIPGGMTQYHLIGKEVLETDAGPCLLPVDESMGYAESALLEPWGCVLAAYTQRRRLSPREGGSMWIVGQPGDAAEFTCSLPLKPAFVVLTDVPPSVKRIAAATGARVIERNGLNPEDFKDLGRELTAGAGFDDILLLHPQSARMVGEAARLIARRGTCNLVGTHPLDGLVQVDLGRLHYDYIAFVGNSGSDLAASYGDERNRCEMRAGGTAVFVGAGGPMGQMHVQRALELPDGPKLVIATEVSEERMKTLQEMFAPLAARLGRAIEFFNPARSSQSFHDFVLERTAGQGADDVVVSVPVAALIEEGASVMNSDGMLVVFAGVPNGTYGAVNLSNVYLSNAQLTGTSGLTIDDQSLVMERRLAGMLSPARSVAAIGGLNSAAEAIQSVMDGRFPGKVVLFPQIPDLPLMAIRELRERLPMVAAKLGEDQMWTRDAEEALIDQCWEAPRESAR
ncbi:MAG: alcohol dehydrogenase catalytic domain-containing protein [Terracidiphilus sp.]